MCSTKRYYIHILEEKAVSISVIIILLLVQAKHIDAENPTN